MIIEQLYTKCLSQGAYYIESNGEAAVIDPLRDIEEYLDLAAAHQARILYVFETHFHADFVSGHIDLSKKTQNTVFILFVEESQGSAGGRIGGAGFRRISRIICFHITEGVAEKIFETSDEMEISKFEIPLSAVAMDIKLSDGVPKVVQGVVDEDLVKTYLDLIH